MAKNRTTKKPKVPVRIATEPVGGIDNMPARKRHAQKVQRRLKADYPDAECALHHGSPFQLLIATILSAQCTDVRVNKVTPPLFKKYPTSIEFAKAKLSDLEEAVRSTGFYRNKAKNIQKCSQQLVERHNGEVPQTLEELVELAGTGRKTANVVLGVCFGIASGVVVDTHVGRISRRLGLTIQKDAVKVEYDLMDVLPKAKWVIFSHWMISHGRAICDAKKPLCEECSMKKICPRIGLPL